MTQNKQIDFSCRRRLLVGMVCALLLMGGHAYADDTPLTVGILPYQGPQQLVSKFSPLRDYLQQASARKLTLVTAPSYPEFRARTKAGEYDIILTAPHFARVAELESGFKRIAVTRYRVHGAIFVAKDSPAQQLSDLIGKSLSIPPPAAMVHMLVIELARNNGLDLDRDFKLHTQESMHNSLFAAVRGDSDASVVDFASWDAYEQKNSLREIAKTAEVPGMIIMAHPRVPKAVIASMRKALFAYADTAEGKAYFAITKHGAWLPVDDATMRSIDPYVRLKKD